jgi:peptidoglycan/LPS O-acetylase OafA/YrhL
VDELRDDRITPETKVTAALVIAVLLLALLALYVEPDHTDQDFAWTVLPRTSAVLIGAGYTAGAYFFARVLGEKKWHRVQAGFLAITGFTVCMLAATLLHLDSFHLGSLAFYAWLLIYALTPFVVPFLWWRNRSHASPDLEDADVRFSSAVRWALGAGAALGILAFIRVFFTPSLLIALAPWRLTPLTARIFTGWTILALLTVVNIALDGRWSAAKFLVQSAMVALGLTLIALPRIWSDFDQSKPFAFVFVVAAAATLLALVLMHLWLDAAARRNSAATR